MWGATTETERETKRNKCGCKMLSVFEPECSLPSCLSCLLSEIKIGVFEMLPQRRTSVFSVFGKGPYPFPFGEVQNVKALIKFVLRT